MNKNINKDTNKDEYKDMNKEKVGERRTSLVVCLKI